MKTQTLFALLTCFVLAPLSEVVVPGVFAQEPEAGDYIRTEAVRPEIEKMTTALREVRMGQRNMDDLLKTYAARTADPKRSKRERAIAWFVQGRLLTALGRGEDAARAWRTSLELYSRFPDAHVHLGGTKLIARNVKGARKYAKAALAIHRQHVKALVLLGRIAESEAELEKAIRFYLQAYSFDQGSSHILMGLASNYARLYKQSFNAERKSAHASRARGVVDAWVEMEPNLVRARLFQAHIFKSLDDAKTAISRLETMLVEIPDLSPDGRLRCLGMIFETCLGRGDVAGGIKAAERILAVPGIRDDQATHYRKLLEDLKEQGVFAYLKWRVDAQIKIVSNRGRSPTERRDAMRSLHSLMENPQYVNDPRFTTMIEGAWQACVRTLGGNAPPELSIDMLKFFRVVPRDPKTIRIVVHFLYPQGIESNVTENVRIEATRTYAALGDVAAIPTLLYTLSDDSRGVSRAIDIALCGLLDVRSKIKVGAGPVTLAEQKLLRREWVRWSRSPSGARELAKSIAALRKLVGGDNADRRKQQRNPIADHVLLVVVMDDAMPFETWKAGYEFLCEFVGRNFLPPELRKKPLSPELRAAAVKGVRKFWMGG